MAHTRTGGIGFWLILILLAAILVGGGVFLAAAPRLKRERMLANLTDPSPSTRAEALGYAATRLYNDPEVRQAVFGALESGDQKVFMDVVQALDAAGLWAPGNIPCDAWLREARILADFGQDEDTRTASRVTAARRLAQATPCARTHAAEAAAILEQLSHAQAHPDVRYNALIAAVLLARQTASGDGDGPRADQPYIVAIERLTRDQEVVIAEQAWIFAGLLGVAGTFEDHAGATARTPTPMSADAMPRDADAERIAHARRWARTYSPPATRPEPPVLELERQPATERSQAIELLLRSDIAAQRDVGCLLATEHLDVSERRAMIAALLADEDLDSIRSGIVLWALGVPAFNDDTELTAALDRLSTQHPHEIEPLAAMGRWLAGDHPELDDVADLLFARPEVPMSTTALMLLERDHRSIVLDHLLNPIGQPPVDLYELLVDHAWWRVLAGYLPAGAPRIDLDASYTQKRFQIDVLRNWYLLEREKDAKAAASTASPPPSPSVE